MLPAVEGPDSVCFAQSAPSTTAAAAPSPPSPASSPDGDARFSDSGSDYDGSSSDADDGGGDRSGSGVHGNAGEGSATVTRMRGTLRKRGHGALSTGWRVREFVLEGQILRYFKGSASRGKPKGVIALVPETTVVVEPGLTLKVRRPPYTRTARCLGCHCTLPVAQTHATPLLHRSGTPGMAGSTPCEQRPRRS
jgi:hypothetical protein